MPATRIFGVFCLSVIQAYSADQRLRICNHSNAEVMPQVIYLDDVTADARWIAEAPRVLSSAGKCMDLDLSPTAEQGYIQVMIRRASDGQAWFLPAWTAQQQYSDEVAASKAFVWFRPTKTRVCIPQDGRPTVNGAPPPPRKRVLGADIAPLNNGGCARGNAVTMNLQFSLPAPKSTTLYVTASEFRFNSN